jgi:multimeric flavodoxin WrbA
MAENEKARDQIRIVAICGSLRPGSYTRMALQVTLRGACEIGAEATLIDLRDYQLIFCDGKKTRVNIPKTFSDCGRRSKALTD